MLKNGILIPALLGVMTVTSCSSPEQQPAEVGTDSLQASVQGDEALAESKSNLLKLADYAGQYPSDVQLFDNKELNHRIKLLLGEKYGNFRKFWQTETPILIEDQVLFTTGCEQHNCAANQYVLQIDLKNDNVNIFHIGSDFKSYTEKGPIHLPPGLAKEFLIIKGNTSVVSSL